MAFFNFLKGKNKKTEEEQNLAETQQESSVLEVEGLVITPPESLEKEDGDISIRIDREGQTDIKKDVSRAMDVKEVHFKISAAGTMYNKGSLDDEDFEEAVEFDMAEEFVPETALGEASTLEEEPMDAVEEEAAAKPVKQGFFAKLVEGLGKTRQSIMDSVDTVLGAFTKIDEDLFEELEEVLIMADIGVETTMRIIEQLRKRVKKEKATNPQDVKGLLAEEITAILEEDVQASESLPSPTVMLVIGVNGVGKTTTIGKLAQSFKNQGKSVLIAAADTFRAAAIDQLEVWGDRAGIEVIKQHENADPAAVVFDALSAAKKRKTDLLICDTAGRLHNKKNLMDELKKIAKVIEREYPEAHKEVYLVLDATTGQNAMQQAKLFKEAAEITGIILTKLDGTAKGGIVIAIKSELKIPVRYIGVGEGIADLQQFDSEQFAKALFGKNE